MTGEFDSNGQKLNRKPDQTVWSSDDPASGSSPTDYKKCNWCEALVDPEKCFAMYTGVSLICEICGWSWDQFL